MKRSPRKLVTLNFAKYVPKICEQSRIKSLQISTLTSTRRDTGKKKKKLLFSYHDNKQQDSVFGRYTRLKRHELGTR